MRSEHPPNPSTDLTHIVLEESQDLSATSTAVAGTTTDSRLKERKREEEKRQREKREEREKEEDGRLLVDRRSLQAREEREQGRKWRTKSASRSVSSRTSSFEAKTRQDENKECYWNSLVAEQAYNSLRPDLHIQDIHLHHSSESEEADRLPAVSANSTIPERLAPN